MAIAGTVTEMTPERPADVSYDVQEGKLEAQNHVYIDQLTLGEKVDSPTATKLPVRLGIALLKDKNGVIDVDIPLTGSLDDPQFRVWPLIWKMVGSLFTKAVTSPFRFLAGKGGADRDLSFVAFDPGSAALTDDARGRLDQLAAALADRPGLSLDVTGRVDPEGDRDGLKRAALEQKVKAQQMKALARKGQAPASIDLATWTPEEYPALLKAAYRAESFPKPRTALGLTKDLSVAEMETLILANAPAGEDELRQLGKRRAQAVQEYLTTTRGIATERVFLVASKAGEESGAKGSSDSGDALPAARADFGLR
jgi:outer membrane protein OmpA-like peptidoglycan-associated protein